MTLTLSNASCEPVCRRSSIAWLTVLLIVTAIPHLSAGEPTPAERGYKVLRTKQFLPPDFDQQTFDALWKVWPEPLRSQAKQATPAQRRKLTFSHYGLMEPPGDQAGQGPAIGYVSDGKQGWVMSCLACHAGKVAGKMIPGLGNSHYALQTLTEDVRLTKLSMFKRPSHLDLAALKLPLSTTNGTTNSVVFGVVLGALRDADMNVNRKRPTPKLLHHDMDAPPLWNVKKKRSLYADGFAPKTPRPLMQFMLLPSNNADTVKSWEPDFTDVLAWIESLEPPKYPWQGDRDLAARGKTLFEKTCSRCHGTYGPSGKYTQKTIPLNVIGTDPLRLKALASEHRRWMKTGWLSRYGKDHVELNPVGYVAPPLDGLWASAPYLHNGSVPTLWHLLHADARPTVWKRTEDGYDRAKTGLEIEIFKAVPDSVKTPRARRTYFDTTRPGKSAAGHRFPETLTEPEKRAVLEYLKTL
jgi:cytochrome c5